MTSGFVFGDADKILFEDVVKFTSTETQKHFVVAVDNVGYICLTRKKSAFVCYLLGKGTLKR